jgi:hypothetical protein
MNEEEYNDLISPKKLFESDKELDDFLEIDASIDDLESFLKICEKDEMYEYCSKIQKKIKKK